MPDSLKSAIGALTDAFRSNAEPDGKRSEQAVQAMATIHERMGLDFAEDFLNQQLRAVPDAREFIHFVNTFGLGLYRKVLYDLAIVCFRFRTDRNPNDKVAFNNMGLCYNRLGMSVEAADAYQRGLDADPDYKQAGSNLLYLQHYIWGADPGHISRGHIDYANRHYRTSANRMAGSAVDLDPERPLRLGFVSGDLRFHAVSRFIEGIFAALNRSRWSLFVYHTYNGAEDTITDELRAWDLQWNRVGGLDTDQLIERIRGDQIDILFDLSVYTQGGKPDVFAQQIAPIQINYMGYPDTSGIPAMNWRITDDVSDPPGVDSHYSEKLARLPCPLWNYTPWPNLPAPAEPPSLKNGYITFGSMNNHAKLQKEWLMVWADVLRAVPNSVLLLKSRAMNSERIVAQVLQLFASRGIARQRILPRTFQSRPNDHFLTFHDIDICLDSVPYNGTTTTFDSLWMGVPVATMSGDLHVTRTSASILTGMGLSDWVADDPGRFVEICRTKAQDSAMLTGLRAGMRERMQATTLGDADQFCAHFDSLLRGLWRDYCADPPDYLATGPASVAPAPAAPGISVYSESDVVSISVVVCAANRQNLDAHRRHVTETIGIEFEYIAIDNSDNRYSLAAAYNAGGDLAKADIIVFLHDDVYLANQSWGLIVVEKFKQQRSPGLLGVAGTACLQTQYPFWVASKEPFIHGQVIHHNKRLRLSTYSGERDDQDVVAIDGLFMAVSRVAFRQHRFDDEVFDGFHFYDIDFSVRVSETYRVAVTRDLTVKHLSGGKFDDAWKQYRDRFRNKHAATTAWQCLDGEPGPDAHLRRLTCHSDLAPAFSEQQIQHIDALGLDHPKHPDFGRSA